MDKVDEIHDFWYQGIDDATVIHKKEMPFRMWFMKNQEIDDEIRDRFENELIAASKGKREDWKENLKGRLALVLLFDQFSRNIYRNTPRMFAFDKYALALSLETIQKNEQGALTLIERVFLYLPFEHAEDLGMQEQSLRWNRSLIKESRRINPANTPYYEYTFEYAQRHYDIIKRFGRFPHRNKILGRASTAEEEAFMKQPASSF